MNDQPDHIMQFFYCDTLPAHLQTVAKPFDDLAWEMAGSLPRNDERTIALRKLLEAKDAAVRAVLSKFETKKYPPTEVVERELGVPITTLLKKSKDDPTVGRHPEPAVTDQMVPKLKKSPNDTFG